jgi:hypothetical protein
MAARTIFVMFYAGAVEGLDRWIRPSQVTDMTDIQSALMDDASREAWSKSSLSQSKTRPRDTWYATNSREPIRDETIRTGLIPSRAVLERAGVATTSSRPKYALEAEFAALFDSELSGYALTSSISKWRETHLSKAALTRQRLIKEGAEAAVDAVTITFPGGEPRHLAPGPSSVIAKALVEEFATRFLKKPTVLWMSESGNKVVARDERLAASLGLKIDPNKALPDTILVDLGVDASGKDMLVLFVEIVATDGPINRLRKDALLALAIDAGFDTDNLAFLTAYLDRSSPAFRKTVAEIASGTFVWFVSEPDQLLQLHEGPALKLSHLVRTVP